MQIAKGGIRHLHFALCILHFKLIFSGLAKALPWLSDIKPLDIF